MYDFAAQLGLLVMLCFFKDFSGPWRHTINNYLQGLWVRLWGKSPQDHD